MTQRMLPISWWQFLCLDLRKFNVNMETQSAHLEVVQKPNKDVVHAMVAAKEAMKAVFAEKMYIFGSGGESMTVLRCQPSPLYYDYFPSNHVISCLSVSY